MGRAEIGCFEVRIFENSPRKVALIKNRLAKIGLNKFHFAQLAIAEGGFLQFLPEKRREVQDTGFEGKRQQKGTAFVEAQSEQFAVIERGIAKRCILDLRHAEIAIFKQAIYKNYLGQVRVGKYTVNEPAVLVFAFLQPVFLEINAFKLVICGVCLVHGCLRSGRLQRCEELCEKGAQTAGITKNYVVLFCSSDRRHEANTATFDQNVFMSHNRFHQTITALTFLSEESMQLLFEIAELQPYEQGSILLERGQVCESIWFIEKGCLRTFTEQDGVEINLDFQFAGEFSTNSKSLQTEMPSENTIHAMENSMIWELRQDDLLELYAESGEIATFGRKLIEALRMREEGPAE